MPRMLRVVAEAMPKGLKATEELQKRLREDDQKRLYPSPVYAGLRDELFSDSSSYIGESDLESMVDHEDRDNVFEEGD
ncbi:unnamed protein product, partial [Mesorhabditis spiculigera]